MHQNTPDDQFRSITVKLALILLRRFLIGIDLYIAAFWIKSWFRLVFEPTCASCTVSSFASLSVCLWKKCKSDKCLQHGKCWGKRNDPSALSICLSMLVICGNIRLGSMSTSSCIFWGQHRDYILSHASEVGSPTNHPGSFGPLTHVKHLNKTNLVIATYKKF